MVDQQQDTEENSGKKKLVIKSPPGTSSSNVSEPKAAQKPFITIVLGETGVGKTYTNIHQEIPVYLRADPGMGKQARKVLIYDVNNDYERIRTLPPKPEAINKFIMQSTVEARRIVGKDEFGRPLDKKQNYENVGMIIRTFINGLIILDDIDKYAVHTTKQDFISMLMGNRHIGCHVMTSHQSWRKISVTESENVRFLRIHHALDDIDSLPKEKMSNFEYPLCKIACLIVKEQYQLATNMYEDGKFGQGKSADLKYEQHKSFFVNVDVRRKKIMGVSEKAFQRAAYKFMMMRAGVVEAELQELMFMGQIDHMPTKAAWKNPTLRNKAMHSLYEKYKRYIK